MSATKPIVDARLRTEDVDQLGLANDANAITLRARLGFETGKAWNTSLLVEGEAVVPLENDYRPDPSVPTMVTYPVVPDPESYEVNRFQLVNTSLPGTTLTLGRQRILLDDQRFVGNVGWRQNEQTFDAFRIVNKSVKNLVLDATYLNRVNRIFGHDSPQGTYKGDSALLNASYQTKVGKIAAFGYLLQFDDIVGRAGRGARLNVNLRTAVRRREAGRQGEDRLPRFMGHADRCRRQSAGLRPRLPGRRAQRHLQAIWIGRRPRSARRQWRQGLHHAAGDAAQVPGLGGQVPGHARQRHRGCLRECRS